MNKAISPCSVNLIALFNKFDSTCTNRISSLINKLGTFASNSIRNFNFPISVLATLSLSAVSITEGKLITSLTIFILPASILDKSSNSSIRCNKEKAAVCAFDK